MRDKAYSHLFKSFRLDDDEKSDTDLTLNNRNSNLESNSSNHILNKIYEKENLKEYNNKEQSQDLNKIKTKSYTEGEDKDFYSENSHLWFKDEYLTNFVVDKTKSLERHMSISENYNTFTKKTSFDNALILDKKSKRFISKKRESVTI